MSAGLRYRRLGEADYQDTLAAMRRFTDERGVDTPDEFWLLQHPRVFTQGQAGRAEHVLAPGDIPVVQVDRGGQVTYHGPGQWVVYLLVDLKRRGLGVRELVSLIERAIVRVLTASGIDAAADPVRPGVYVDGAKIASLGLRVRRGCSYHGLALNVTMDLEPFGRINPCGYEGLAVTSMAAQLPGEVLDEGAVGEALLVALAEELGEAG
ncbi:lipoyl(octanoyl) transferase LipB [Pseudohaliea rubra]|uniref:Octanoyltransferase n=1 Tax=Pseudohaliea rubra DSM 19751 TaxID=1265313 RepID=A0A095VMH9_9GAMM|nr:lipoyl(octanoyl) transferase LipB [Pseudohaliea rubra]KGE02565.1 Octanoate-[acyl-carrier-protein]-protein-N-octan oyltransferase [Pseudohaliea rubra DSM 19751]